MIYAIITETDIGEERFDIKGTPSLEKYTDSRILRIYRKAKRIYKIYPDSRCVLLKGDV